MGDEVNNTIPFSNLMDFYIGDTLTLSWYFFDWIYGDYGGDEKIF